MQTVSPFKAYCTGLPLPGERKSVEPMAARLDPDHVGRVHQCRRQDVSDAGLSAMAHRADHPRSAFPTRCNASLSAIPVAPDRSRSHRRIDNRARAVPLPVAPQPVRTERPRKVVINGRNAPPVPNRLKQY